MAPEVTACLERFEDRDGVVAAARFTRDLTREIGVCFHPDTPFDDYVNGDTDEPLFSAEDAAKLDSALTRAWRILDQHGVEIYRVALPVQRAMIRDAMKERDALLGIGSRPEPIKFLREK